jgi:hypothetical protein
MAEFTYNDHEHSSTHHTLFYLNYGKHPWKGTKPTKEVKNESAEEFVKRMKRIHEDATSAIKLANQTMKHHYDKGKKPSQQYNIGDKVWLESTNIRTDCPITKLNDKCRGPFTIEEKIGEASYKLKLPDTWHLLHPVFNESLLKPY